MIEAKVFTYNNYWLLRCFDANLDVSNSANMIPMLGKGPANMNQWKNGKSSCDEWVSYITGWWYTYPSEKYESQLGLLFPIYVKIKHAPNHQPDNIDMGDKTLLWWRANMFKYVWNLRLYRQLGQWTWTVQDLRTYDVLLQLYWHCHSEWVVL